MHVNIGRLQLRLGSVFPSRNEQAEVELREAVALLRASPRGRLAGSDFPYALQMLGWAVQRQNDPGKQGEVGKLLEEALQYCRANPSVAPYRRGFALLDVGHWRLLQGDSKTSAPLFAQAEEIWGMEDKNSPHRAQALAWLYAALRRQGQMEAAETAQREAERILRLRPKNQDPVVRRTRELLAGRLPPGVAEKRAGVLTARAPASRQVILDAGRCDTSPKRQRRDGPGAGAPGLYRPPRIVATSLFRVASGSVMLTSRFPRIKDRHP